MAPNKNRSLTPDMATSGSGKKIWWLCKHGNKWKTTVSSRVNRGTGCPICTKVRYRDGLVLLAE